MSDPDTTPLESHLRRLIATEGPIPLSRYMAEVLQHPVHGYYRKGDPLGTRGDFVTAPEISQMFGELIGLWLADRWDAMGRPAPVHLVELGPGRGSLMADARRAMAVVPGLKQALRLHLVESNASLRALQARQLDAHWHDRVETLPDGPLLLVANEFFDALPIRQFARQDGEWHERLVTVADGRLTFTTGAAGPDVALIAPALGAVADGAIVEVCPEGVALMTDIARRVATHGGAALVIDYGYTRHAPGDSLQAVRRHQPVDVFHRPGECDLTAHVNFAALAAAAHAAGAATAGPVTQGDFLAALGIRVRAAMLARRANPRQRRDIDAALRRLVAPDMMGHLFKVLAVTGNEGPVAGIGEARHG
ncbi:MAG: class I SAM-dependent methyltransferase [Rhodothalassiaceae bacterium]